MRIGYLMASIGFLGLVCLVIYTMLGAGGYNRWTKISGVYAVEPAGWDVVCFLEAKRDGISCLKKSEVKK